MPTGTELAVTAAAVGAALSEVDDMVDVLVERVSAGTGADLDGVGPHTRRLLLAVGDVLVGWLLLRRAVTADRLLTAGAGTSAYSPALLGRQAKVARAFATGVLPKVAAEAAVVRVGDPAVMTLTDEEL